MRDKPTYRRPTTTRLKGAGIIVWLVLINETHVRFIAVREVSLFTTYDPMQQESTLYRIFLCRFLQVQEVRIYEQRILYVPGGAFKDHRNRPGARP